MKTRRLYLYLKKTIVPLLQRALFAVPLSIFLFLHFPAFGQTYFVGGIDGLYEVTVNGSTCSSTLIGQFVDSANGQIVTAGDIAICPDGALYITNNTNVWEVNPTTGACTQITSENTYLGIVGLGCAGDGTLYGTAFSFNGTGGLLYEIDLNSGSVIALGNMGFSSSGDLVFYDEQWYMTSQSGLVMVDVETPSNSSLAFPVGAYVAMSVFHGDCNSLLAGSGDELVLINLEEETETPLCSVPGVGIGGLTTLAEFSDPPACEPTIDLNGDDSSGATGPDFDAPAIDCENPNQAPIAGSDLIIDADETIDSMRVTITLGNLDGLDETLSVSATNFINVIGNGTASILLINSGDATISDFEDALSLILYQNLTAPPTMGEREIEVQFWTADGAQSNVATCHILIEASLQIEVNLGPDTSVCASEFLTLDAGFENAAHLWSNGLTAQTIVAPAPGTYAVTVNDGVSCPGSDTIEIIWLNSDTTVFSSTTCDTTLVGFSSENFTNQSGCDSLVITEVTFAEGDTVYVSEESCDPDEAGIFTESYTAHDGCDSTVVLTVSFTPIDDTFIFLSSCDTADTGLVVDVFMNQEGCDSVVFTQTDLLPTDAVFINQTTCDSSEAGIFQEIFSNQFGCDSLVVTTISLSPSDTLFVFDTSCDVEEVGVFEETFINAFGCDSTVISETSLAEGDTTYISEGSCVSEEVGVFTENFTAQNGCDSLVVTTVELLPASSTILNLTTCELNEVDSSLVILSAENGCDSSILTVTRLLSTEECENRFPRFYIPNAFSPNDDGINDRFYIFGNEQVKTVLLLEVFDRWGERVFEIENAPLNDLQNGWGGNFRNEPMDAGVFAYWGEIEMLDGSRVRVEGDLVLLR